MRVDGAMKSALGVLRALAALGGREAGAAYRAALVSSQEHTNGYPEWRSHRKTRGHRDASLRSRSNRRKAQRG